MSSPTERPNLLFVFSDQHRWCDLNAYGNAQVISPHLDQFAAQAVQFENCISNSPLCVPSRGTMLTGLYPLAHGAAGNDLPMFDHVETFGNVLANHGYHTGYIGKWHLAGIPRDQFIPAGRRHGFKEWKTANCTHDYLHSYYYDEENVRHPIEGYDAVEFTNLALDFIERNNGKPWSLVLSWGPPHDPYHHVPQSYLDLYKDTEIELRGNVGERAVLVRDKIDWDRETIRRNLQGYYAHITALDEQFGRLLRKLEQTGQLERTIIVYTSDHGDMLGSHGLTNKQLPYEESIKVPLLVYWQGKTIAKRRTELISLVDLPVSLLGLMGYRFSGQVHGQDFSPLFTDEHAEGASSCYIFDLTACHQSSARGTPEWRGIRTSRYTYAKTVHDDGWLLYDNLADPLQLNNLIQDPEMRQVRAELNLLLDEYIAKYDGFAPWSELAETFGLEEAWEESEAYFRH
jgi:arylsulfatase A-like enzyme